MKLTNMALGLFTATAIFMVGCATNQAVSEESIGLRNTSLYSENEVVPTKTGYGEKAAGESQIIARAFENAPPMIPHTVEGMLPITINNNQCSTCHVDSAPYDKNIPSVPKSHFTDYRPMTAIASNGKITKEGKEVDNTSDHLTASKELATLSGSRFNCSQCHAPQTMTDAPANEFKAEFRASDHSIKSNLVDNINEGVNTLK